MTLSAVVIGILLGIVGLFAAYTSGRVRPKSEAPKLPDKPQDTHVIVFPDSPEIPPPIADDDDRDQRLASLIARANRIIGRGTTKPDEDAD